MPQTHLETRFFSLVKIPQPSLVEGKFVYNYFVPDESINDTGISKYDDGQFKVTSYKSEDGSAYTVDDQGNRMIVDNFGNLVSEDVLLTRAPRIIEIQWTPATPTATTPNQHTTIPTIESLDAAGLLIRQEDIASVYDTNVKFQDPRLRLRLDEKLKTFASLLDQDIYTDTGLSEVQSRLSTTASTLGAMLFRSVTSFSSNASDASFALVDMNKDAGIKRVNDLGIDAPTGQYEKASNYVADIKIDRRLLPNMIHSVYERKHFSSRQLEKHTDIDASNLDFLPKEPNVLPGAAATSDSARESGINMNSPILPAQAISRPGGVVSPFSQTDLLGYVVERYTLDQDFTLENPGKRIYIDSPVVASLIDTEIVYGQAYYYTVRAVYMRESEQYDASTGTDMRVRHFLASNATDPVLVEANESTPPNEPDGVFYKFNYRNGKGLVITWQYPVGRQRDTKYFQIFRRSSINEAFTCIAELDFNDSAAKTARSEAIHEENVLTYNATTTFYEDIEFTRSSKFMYAICSIDAHGLTSALSAQTEVSFIQDRNILELKSISRSGAPKQYPNFFIDPDLDENVFVRTLTQDAMTSSGKQSIKIYLDSDCETLLSGPDGMNTETHTGFAVNNHTYKLHLINIDRHKDDSVEIRLTDYRET
jgi:hypothetical protein